MKNNNNDNNTKYKIMTSLAIIIPLLFAFSYAYFQANIRGVDQGVVTNSTDKFNIDLVTENNGYINATDMLLIAADEVSEESQKGYFKVVTGSNDHYINYSLSLSNLTISSNLQVNDFKWQLLKDNSIINSGTFNGVSGNSMTLATGLIIGENITHSYELRMWIEESDVDQIGLLNGSFSGKVSLTSEMVQNPIPGLKDKIIEQGGGVAAITAKGTPDFSVVNGTSGIYAAQDDYGTSYYYRGLKTVLKNNIIFGGFQWKIIRVNGDGSVRLLYNGTEAQFNSLKTMNDTNTNTRIGFYPWNSTYGNDAKYLGYMYGGNNGTASTSRNGSVNTAATHNQTSSNIKTILETWYQNNIFGKDIEEYVENNLFCNDRQLRSEVGGASTGSGYGGSDSVYAANYRLVANKNPSLKCSLKNDRFTTSEDSILGNGALKYPIGNITADEVAMGGLTETSEDTTNYLYSNIDYMTMTPNNMSNGGYAYMYYVRSNGGLGGSGNVNGSLSVRPVISIKGDVRVSGSGSLTDPFKVI